MATKLRDRTSNLAFERFTHALEHPDSRYPSGAMFVGSEAPHAKAALLRSIREGRPVVVVYPDGSDRVVTVRSDGASLWRRLLTRISLMRRP